MDACDEVRHFMDRRYDVTYFWLFVQFFVVKWLV